MPGLAEAIAFDDPAILGVCLSGAGPSIVALVTDGGRAGDGAARRHVRAPGIAVYDQNFVGASTLSSSEHPDELQSSLPSLPDRVSPPLRSGCATSASDRSRSPTTTPTIAQGLSRELIESRPKNLWRYRELLPIEGEPAHGPAFGVHAARARRPPRGTARRPRALRQGRLGQPSDLFLQGPRRLDRRDARGRARVHGLLLRVDRQPRRKRRLARGAPRALLLRLHPGRSRSRQGRRRQHLPPAHHRRARQLRRRESAVHAGGGQVRVGLCQHQPARLLRRRREDLRLRDRRAARLEVSRGTSSRRSPAARCCRASSRASASCAPSAWSTASCRRSTPRRRPAARRSSARSSRPRVPRSGQAEHDRQVDRHRQPGRRLPGAALGPRRPAARARW